MAAPGHSRQIDDIRGRSAMAGDGHHTFPKGHPRYPRNAA
jgi:hypothetical protein